MELSLRIQCESDLLFAPFPGKKENREKERKLRTRNGYTDDNQPIKLETGFLRPGDQPSLTPRQANIAFLAFLLPLKRHRRRWHGETVDSVRRS